MPHDHRRLAIDFNQRAWTLIDRKDRSTEEADEMIGAAHASLMHWLKAGTGVNQQRGEWLIARAYAEAGRAEPARHHLDRMLALTERYRDDLADFDIAFAEALAARVEALSGRSEAALVRYAEAQRLGEAIGDEDDRRAFFDQLREGPWFGLEPPT
ncbi:MAG: hypothetical protein KDK07_11360 [Bauldia sp.]|nr:hypothetical protein [Bauldia sp.]